MTLLDATLITTEVRISERDLHQQLIREVMQQFGLLDEAGQPRPGVTGVVQKYGDSRRPQSLGYAVRITRDMSKSTDKALPPPISGERVTP